MKKILLMVSSWWVVVYNGIIVIILTIEIVSRGTWIERVGLEPIAFTLSRLWFILIPIISTIALIINRHIRWKLCNYIHGVALFIWLFSVILCLWIFESGLAYW
jgi:hypothetical protein